MSTARPFLSLVSVMVSMSHCAISVSAAENGSPFPLGIVVETDASNLAPAKEQQPIPSTPANEVAKRATKIKFDEPPEYFALGDLGRILKRVVLTTIVLVAACFITYFLSKKRSKQQSENATAFEVTDRLFLASRNVLELVQVHGQSIVVARDGSGIKGLISLPRPFEAALQQLDETGDEETVDADQGRRDEGSHQWKPINSTLVGSRKL